MKMIKSFVAAAALMVAASSAFAATTVSLVQDPLNTKEYTGAFTVYHTTGLFTDTFNFTPDLSKTLVSAIVTSIGFKSTTDINFSSVTLNGNALSITNGAVDTAWTPSELTLTGPLTLVVSGTSGANASYSGTVNVTAVPEPETYAMMIAGMGLVGFVARRRKAANQA